MPLLGLCVYPVLGLYKNTSALTVSGNEAYGKHILCVHFHKVKDTGICVGCQESSEVSALKRMRQLGAASRAASLSLVFLYNLVDRRVALFLGTRVISAWRRW